MSQITRPVISEKGNIIFFYIEILININIIILILKYRFMFDFLSLCGPVL